MSFSSHLLLQLMKYFPDKHLIQEISICQDNSIHILWDGIELKIRESLSGKITATSKDGEKNSVAAIARLLNQK